MNVVGKRISNTRIDSQQGFTLLELLITLVVLTIGLLGTAGLTTGIIRGNFFAKNITSATVVAQTQLEAIQRAGYAGAVINDVSGPFKSADTVSMSGMNFSRTTAITTASNMRTVTVTVTWNEANNASRSVTLQTTVAQ
ncbi:MAG: type IV pilus modification PilV family protein [Candidatus Binatia bacterium]